MGPLSLSLAALCFSELGVNFPASGGEYVYLTRAYGPAWGFITGWVSFFAGFSAPIAVAALAFSDYLGYFLPALKQENAPAIFGSGDWTFKLGGAQIVASGLVLLFTHPERLWNSACRSNPEPAHGCEDCSDCRVCRIRFLVSDRETGPTSVRKRSGRVETSLPQQFAISLFWIYVSYSGWNAATYVAEEIKQPGKTLPKALTFGTILVATLYVLLNVVFLYAAPLEQMKGVIAIGSLAASKLFGPEVASAFSALMALSLVSTVSAMVTVGPRVYYAMAKNGAFFRSAAHVHESTERPSPRLSRKVFARA